MKDADENSKSKLKNKDKVIGRENATTTTKDELEEFWGPIWENAIDRFLQSHEEKYRLIQIDQKGGKAKTMGCVDNLLIDKMVLEDAHFQKKNLTCSWVDVRKAF